MNEIVVKGKRVDSFYIKNDPIEDILLGSQECKSLFDNMSLNKGIHNHEISLMYKKYNEDVMAYDNSIYEPLSNRFVQFLNSYNKNSWHIPRNLALSSLLGKMKYKSIIDLGFGVPQTDVLLDALSKNAKITLSDKYYSAIEFGECFVKHHRRFENTDFVSFLELDLKESEKVGQFDVYILFDSIEHSDTPEESLIKLTKNAHLKSKFIFSIPIGPKIPSHNISWPNEIEAKNWLNRCGLKILETENVYPNSKGDLFTNLEDVAWYNHIVVAEKH